MYKYILSLLILVCGFAYADTSEIENFITHVSNKHNIPRTELDAAFSGFTPNQHILRLISKPFESMSWPKYRERLLTQERIYLGVEFWKRYEKELAQIELEYKIPTEYLIAIVGVETYYGKNAGTFNAFDALATLAFGYPRRADFFKQELEHLFVLAKKHKFDLTQMRASYAGALGTPQFMPSSYLNYAVKHKDSNADSVDLFNDVPTALASVANYLVRNGWKSGELVCQPLIDPQLLTSKEPLKNFRSPKPTLSIKELNNLLKFELDLNPQHNFAILAFDSHDPNSAEYWLAGQNFYAITRYNLSNNYALAVHQLSQAIRQQYNMLK